MCLNKHVVLEPGLNRSVCKLPRIPGERCDRLHILSDIPLKLLVSAQVRETLPHHHLFFKRRAKALSRILLKEIELILFLWQNRV
jgi:hypothetical protein